MIELWNTSILRWSMTNCQLMPMWALVTHSIRWISLRKLSHTSRKLLHWSKICLRSTTVLVTHTICKRRQICQFRTTSSRFSTTPRRVNLTTIWEMLCVSNLTMNTLLGLTQLQFRLMIRTHKRSTTWATLYTCWTSTKKRSRLTCTLWSSTPSSQNATLTWQAPTTTRNSTKMPSSTTRRSLTPSKFNKTKTFRVMLTSALLRLKKATISSLRRRIVLSSCLGWIHRTKRPLIVSTEFSRRSKSRNFRNVRKTTTKVPSRKVKSDSPYQ